MRLRVSTCDAVILKGLLYAISKVEALFVRLNSLEGEGGELCVTHQELGELLAQDASSIEYGYFSSRQAARRAVAGRSLMTKLPIAEQWRILWKIEWAEVFLEAEANNEVTRSDRSYSKNLARLTERVANRLLGTADGIQAFGTLCLNPPCRSSLLAAVRKWEKTRDPMALTKRSRFNGQNGTRISPEREAILQSKIPEFLHPQGIRYPELTRSINAEVSDRNRMRAGTGIPTIEKVSLSTVRRRVDEIAKFEVLAARRGVAEAKNTLGSHGAVLPIDVPLQRVEMDEWEIDLMAILAGGGADITDEKIRELGLGRYWVYALIDAASRSVLAIKLSKAPCVADAMSAVWLAMRDKTEIARNLGCETPWKQHGHIFHLIVDNGSSLVDWELKAALNDLNVEYSVMPAGVPKLRRFIERLFGTLARMLMPHLTGRTFSNIKERGDYPSEKYAVHTAESIVEALVRFTVDIYHNKAHSGLEYACPNNEWDRLCLEKGWAPPPSKHKLRHFLGIKLERKLGRHGILVCGLNYHSEALAKHFQRSGGERVDVRMDPEDLGWISVWFAGEWHSVPSVLSQMDGVSFAAWEAVVLELRQRNRDASALNQEIINKTYAYLKELDAGQRQWRRLGPINVTAADIRRAEAETFFGLNLRCEPNAPPAKLDAQGAGFLTDIIHTSSAVAAPLDHADLPSTHKPEDWGFSDE